MKLLKTLMIASTSLVPALALAADPVPATKPATTMAPMTEAAAETCAGITWNPQFLADYPKAPAACREVTVKDGMKYAKFEGAVAKVDAGFVEVSIFNVADTPIGTVGFQVGVGGKVTMDGKEARVMALKVGDHVTFWVREGQFGVSPTLEAEPLKIVRPVVMPTP